MVLSTAPASLSVPPIVEINNVSLAPLYAAPSERPNAILNDEIKVNFFLDDGSDVNILPRRIFDNLYFPIDIDILRRINSFGSKSPPDGSVGVCHELSADIGRVEVKVSVVVGWRVSAWPPFGAALGKMAHVGFINEDNGIMFVGSSHQMDIELYSLSWPERITPVIDLREGGWRILPCWTFQSLGTDPLVWKGKPPDIFTVRMRGSWGQSQKDM